MISAFFFGLLGSFHCIGMCGPIAFMLPVDRKNKSKKALQVFIYHFGRLLAYSIIGFIFGILGRNFVLFGYQQQLSIIIGLIMILAVLIPLKKESTNFILKPYYLFVSKLKSKLGKTFKKRSIDAFFTIGILNGFLPCGLIYMAVLGAIAQGKPIESSFYMLFFGLGTIPLMTATVYLGQFLNATIRQRIQKMIPFFVVFIGLLFVLRGLGLGIPYISPYPEMMKIGGSIVGC